MSSSGKDVEMIPKTAELRDFTTKCWSEIFVFFHSLRPEHPSTIAIFECTPGFSPIVSAVLSLDEYSKVRPNIFLLSSFSFIQLSIGFVQGQTETHIEIQNKRPCLLP